MKLVSKDIMDYLIQASKDRDCIFEKWRHTIDLNTDILGDNKKLIELVSETNDRNEELIESIRSNNKDIIRLCDVLNGILKRMDDIDLRLNVLCCTLHNTTKENNNDQT